MIASIGHFSKFTLFALTRRRHWLYLTQNSFSLPIFLSNLVLIVVVATVSAFVPSKMIARPVLPSLGKSPSVSLTLSFPLTVSTHITSSLTYATPVNNVLYRTRI